MDPAEPPRSRGLRLHDLLGLVVGYSFAALLARSFWPGSQRADPVVAVALGIDYVWLGLAMSGPILLLLDRRGTPRQRTQPKPRKPPKPGYLISQVVPMDRTLGRHPLDTPDDAPPRYTRSEIAWIFIGGYWMALTIFVVPAFLAVTSWTLLGLLQLVALLQIWWFPYRKKKTPTPPVASWTHTAAVGLLWTWPIAWLALVVLGHAR